MENVRASIAIAENALRPCIRTLPDDFDSYDAFLKAVRTLNFPSTPGYPYCLEATSIGEWLGYDGFDGFSHVQLQRLWIEVQQVLRDDYDPIFKVFIKQEPHKKSKADVDRWRLIICFPLCLQVAFKMMFEFQNQAFLDEVFEIPVQHGFKLVGGDWKAYYMQWSSLGYNMSTDFAAFDFGTTFAKALQVLELRTLLVRGLRVTEWKNIASALYRMIYVNAKLLLPNGELWKIIVQALQKSGGSNTLSDNGLLGFLQSIQVSLSEGWPLYPFGSLVGDDGLFQRKAPDEDYLRAYKTLGWHVKQVENGMDYIGHRFTAEGPQPQYVEKHLWNLVYTADEILPDYVESMCRLYTHSPLFEMWQRIAEKLNVVVLSHGYYKVWYDHERCDIRTYW